MMETVNQGEKSMKPELLTNRDAAITTPDEENVRGRIDGHAEEDWLQQKAK
jgi:hypothetical protein